VSVEVSDGSERLDELLGEGFTVRGSGWKGERGRRSHHVSTRHFYGEVARRVASLGRLRLAFLRSNGRPITFQFDRESGRTSYSLEIGYGAEFERFSPGKLSPTPW
jgi:Acetyltransferase (GNAT) domain